MDYQKIELFFQNVQDKIADATAELPEVIGNEVVNFALENFEKESFDGQPWKKRKSKKDEGRKLLVKSGRLKRSPRITSSTPTSVTVGSDVPYARVHNDGLEINRAARSETFVRNRYTRGKRGAMFGGMGAFKKGTSAGQGLSFKAYSYQMPARPFLKSSPGLQKRLSGTAKDHIQERLKQL